MDTMGYVGIGLGIFNALVIIGMQIYLYVIMKDHSVICPICGHAWKPKIYKVIFTVHFFESVLLKCPRCCKRGMKNLKKDEEIEKLLMKIAEESKDNEDVNIEQ